MGLKQTIEALRGSSSDINKEGEDPWRKGKIHEPLIHIPLQNVVPGELHLLLHVIDVFIRNLMNGAMAQWRSQAGPTRAYALPSIF